MVKLRQIELKVREFGTTGRNWNVQRGSDEWQHAVLLLAAYYTGQYAAADLATFTGFDADWIAERKERLETNGIWMAGQTYQSWFLPDGVVAFWCDVFVAQGKLRRRVNEFGCIRYSDKAEHLLRAMLNR